MQLIKPVQLQEGEEIIVGPSRQLNNGMDEDHLRRIREPNRRILLQPKLRDEWAPGQKVLSDPPLAEALFRRLVLSREAARLMLQYG